MDSKNSCCAAFTDDCSRATKLRQRTAFVFLDLLHAATVAVKPCILQRTIGKWCRVLLLYVAVEGLRMAARVPVGVDMVDSAAWLLASAVFLKPSQSTIHSRPSAMQGGS